MNTYQPTPTQYKGILFKSKSEAVIARCFDILTERKEGGVIYTYEYEPVKLKLSDGYIPDFYFGIWYGPLNNIKYMIVEFKPGKVTNAYKNQLTGRFKQYNQIIKNNPLPTGFTNRISSALWICNLYDDSTKTYQVFEEDNKWSEERSIEGLGINKEIIEEAKKYRFDLDQSETQISHTKKPDAPTKLALPTVVFANTPPKTKGRVKMPALKDIKAQLGNPPNPLPF